MNKNDLMSFCSDENRKGITEPWSEGEYTYATNGHILIRVPRLDDVPQCDLAPKTVDKMFPESCPEKLYLVSVIHTSDSQEPRICPLCNGAGKPDKCPECKGEGTVELSNWYNDYEVECASCEGTGKPPQCELCHGTGKVSDEIPAPVKIGHFWLAEKYVRLLKTLPGCVIGNASHDPLKPAYYRFFGGDGLLMPIRPPISIGGRVT